MQLGLRIALVAFLVVSGGCRPRLLGLLDSPSFTARDVLEDVRQAHSGGRRVLSMQFMSEENFHAGTGELFYPELAPSFTALSFYDFEKRLAWQKAARGQQSVLWSWDGTQLKTLWNGQPYTPRLGVDRSIHLRALLLLLQPADGVARSSAELVRVADKQGRPRIRARGVDATIPECVLEVDPETSLLTAVEYRLREIPPLVNQRMELSDYREINGVMVPHQITETLPSNGAGVEFHSMSLWNVEVAVASAYPGTLEPRSAAPTPPRAAVQ